MTLFDVYPLFDITPVKAKGSYIWDDKEQEYLDFYGGHAVISIGHSHPHYVQKVTEQLQKIGFYSNAVKIPVQEELAKKLGQLSGYGTYHLFLCNSGTEANENAIKLASFHNGRKKVIAFEGAFHGRTSLSLAVTDDAKLSATVNKSHDVVFVPLNDEARFLEAMDDTVCAVIIEGIQGVGGIQVPETSFFRTIQQACEKHGAILIADEIQSGCGRTGTFFAHQEAGIQPHIITVAKGMGNGFPVAATFIHPSIKATHGMLGTTFGGNYLACVASLAVLDVMEKEQLIQNAGAIGNYIMDQLRTFEGVKAVRGKGLMIGIETKSNASEVRKKLLQDEKVFTGYSSSNQTIRLLPPLNITKTEADKFLTSFKKIVQQF